MADFGKLIELNFPVPIEVLNACAASPGTWVPSTAVFERAGVEARSGRGQIAGFGYSVRTTSARKNPPWEAQWHAESEHVAHYRLDADTAADWLATLESETPEGT